MEYNQALVDELRAKYNKDMEFRAELENLLELPDQVQQLRMEQKRTKSRLSENLTFEKSEDVVKVVEEMKSALEIADQQICNNKYKIMKHSHALQEMKFEVERNTQSINLQESTFTKKIETEIIQEELQNLMSYSWNNAPVRSSETDSNKVRDVDPL